MRHARCWRLGVAIASTLVVGLWTAPGGPVAAAAVTEADRLWVVGDSWVDGAAAHAGGAAFIAYGADPAELARRGVAPRIVLHDLRAIAGWLETAAW